MRPTQLYLDTARLGRMSPRAQQAHLDFTRLAGEEGASAFFERFLSAGTDEWSSEDRNRFPGLTCWRGIGPLKASLRTLAGSQPELPLLVASRSAELMKFAARLLLQSCRQVLVTDLGWPPYHSILDGEARRCGRRLSSVPLRELVAAGDTTDYELIETVRCCFQKTGCDGLFLPAVSHDGLRLPVERIVRRLEAVRELRFVVIDGAQDFCHASASLSHDYGDLYLAGCHKWLQGFHAMGLGFYGRRRSSGIIEMLLVHLLASGELSDPLLKFTTQLETLGLDGVTETVNLIPLFTCQGAAADALELTSSVESCLNGRRENAATAARLASESGWRPLLPAQPFRTGILLLQAARAATCSLHPVELRRRFAERGLALTAYEGGVVRISAPSTAWQPTEIEQLKSGLELVA
jgi:selenocysteine lyase/cysteine desulfurase